MAWIVKHDAHDNIRLTACTSPLGAQLMREHGIDPADLSTFLVLTEGRALIRSAGSIGLRRRRVL